MGLVSHTLKASGALKLLSEHNLFLIALQYYSVVCPNPNWFVQIQAAFHEALL
jgi:hypothetical protein